MDLQTIRVSPTVLGEGSFGCVLKSADGRYAIKVQETTDPAKCIHESSVQSDLLRAVPDAAVSKVYFYSANERSIPTQWRATLSTGGCHKAVGSWAQRGWQGRFCVTVMDFLPGKPPAQLSSVEFPEFCRVLLHTVQQGYAKIGFQHLDIKPENIIMTPNGARLVDFGISGTRKSPASTTNIGGTQMITPFEVLVGRIAPQIPHVQRFMYRYHWSYDLFSIGITMLNATVFQGPMMMAPYIPITGTEPYIDALLLRYAIPAQASLQTRMVLYQMYNLCILQHELGNGSYPDNVATTDVYYPPGSVGYDLLRSAEGRAIIDYIVQLNRKVYRPYLTTFRQRYGNHAIDLLASLLRWNPEKRGGGQGKASVKKGKSKSPPPKDGARQARLERNVMTLYHQTSMEAAVAIVSSQHFRPGKTGILGGGIYFATTPEDTFLKAHFAGVMLVADVLVGRSKTFERTDYNKDVTFEKLLREGYDSAYVMRNSGPEYVVYKHDQVRNIRFVNDGDVIARELQQRYEPNEAAGMMFLIIGRKAGRRVVLLGRELGGAYKGQYNMYGGRHDKSRTRAETAQAEWCEEFGASAENPRAKLCKGTPSLDALNKAPKIWANLRLEKGGPSKTTIVILWDLGKGAQAVSVKRWNEYNAEARANPQMPKSYKEMDRLAIFDLEQLSVLAARTPVGKPAARVKPVEGEEGTVSFFALQTLRDMKKKKYI